MMNAPVSMRIPGAVAHSSQSNSMPHASAVYSSGATTGGGASRKASVMKY
jgi:hypothetical protein